MPSRSRSCLFLPACLFSTLLFALDCPSLRAQVAAWPLDGPSFSASAAEISQAAAKIAPEKFADATVLYEESHYTLDADGRLTNTHRLVYRIETAAAVENWSEAAVEWASFYQKQPVIRARVIEKDNHVVELDPSTLTDTPAHNEEDGTYSDERIRKGPLPAVSAGSIVEEETVLVDTEPFFRGGGIYRNFLQRYVPVVRSRVVVEAPDGTPLDYRVADLPDLAIKKEDTGGMRRITFDQGHIDPIQRSDIELATPELHTPMIQFSTGRSWAAVAQSYRELSDPQIHPESVTMLLPPAGLSRQATIAALVSRLHKEVRYTGIEFGESKLQPQPASEVLKRHYGDCKDKATLLVAMLRAAGIPADLALLNAGVGMDVLPELPGMNQFNHAIVYVPASGSDPAIWIDATAEFAGVGTLPYQDRGRHALIIADGTQALADTPAARPEDSLLVETRTFELPGYGPAHVIETSSTEGDIDSFYRAVYGGAENKQLRENLTNYVRNAYIAKDLGKIEHGDGADFAKPFTLKLDVPGARRGFVSLDDASVYVPATGLLDRLPSWFGVDPNPPGRQLTPDEETERQKAEHARSSTYLVHPFITEWRYVIEPPAGFEVRGLPPSRTTQMGPATLSEQYSIAEKTGVVTAVLRFNTGKENYSVEDALALRKAVLALEKTDATGILFDQAGVKLLAAGKTREGLAADQKLIDFDPKDGLHHAQMAYALVHAGVGDKAREEARKAVELAPASAIAYAALGEVLEYNSIGVQYAPGFDLAGARAAYRKAAELDPDESNYRLNLAIIEEFDAHGTRYAADADLAAAIDDYRALAKQDKATADRYEDNLLFALFYAKRFDELLKELEPLPGSTTRHGFAIAAVTALKGAPAGIERANQLGGDAAQRGQAMRQAGTYLTQLSLFPQAADILAAASQGSAEENSTARQVEILRSLKPVVPLPATDPASPVQQFFLATLRGTLDETTLTRILARHAYTDEAWKLNLKKNLEGADSYATMARRSGTLPKALGDITLGTMKLTTQGDEASGYRVTAQSIGARAEHYFVVKEDGLYRIAAGSSDFAEVGTEALYLLSQGQEKEARSLLDWRRELLHKGGGDDPLTGPLLPRFWTAGESGDVKLAAASLLAGTNSIAGLLPYVAEKRAALPASSGNEERANLDLLLSYGYLWTNDAAHAQASSQSLLAVYPDSYVALRLAGEAYGLSGNYKAWNAMLQSHLDKHPDDRELLNLAAAEAGAEGDFPRARKDVRAVLDGGQAEVNDYNQYAWLTLFGGPVEADAVEAAQQANTLSKSASFSILHTLACVYAAQGKATEARQALLQGMASANMASPNSPAWFALGAIYEDYGLIDAAKAAYQKVEKPEGQIDPLDTYVLAQRKLKQP